MAAATRCYRRGERISVRAIATEVGLGRATLYRWFGSREKLIGEVLLGAAEHAFAGLREATRGRGGHGLLEAFDGYNRAVAADPALRTLVERERETALRILAGPGTVRPRIVEQVKRMIEEEASAGTYSPPIEPEGLAYAIVRLGEAFIFNDAVIGVRGDVERLREVQAALLGVGPGEGSHGEGLASSQIARGAGA